MDRISEKEKVRIAELLAEGAPAWGGCTRRFTGPVMRSTG